MAAAGTATPIEHAPERPGEQRTSYLDVSKAASELEWRPAVLLEEGLARTFAWFQARRAAKAGRPALERA